MGTNYYFQNTGSGEKLHIGKSSGGWCFALHIYPDVQTGIKIKNLLDWILLFPLGKITDEYGNHVSAEEMINEICGRSWKTVQSLSAKEYKQNHAMPGPNNLVRSRIGHNCVGHGIGTWDLFVGDFS